MVNKNLSTVKQSKPDPVKQTPLPITQHGDTRRAAVTLQLDEERDADLIEWLNATPNKNRQSLLKEALRIGKNWAEPPKDTLRSWFEDLHAYLEGKFSSIRVVSGTDKKAAKAPESAKVSSEILQKRAKNIGNEDF